MVLRSPEIESYEPYLVSNEWINHKEIFTFIDIPRYYSAPYANSVTLYILYYFFENRQFK